MHVGNIAPNFYFLFFDEYIAPNYIHYIDWIRLKNCLHQGEVTGVDVHTTYMDRA